MSAIIGTSKLRLPTAACSPQNQDVGLLMQQDLLAVVDNL